MVSINHRVTDISQVKFHTQDAEGVCVSFENDKWLWMPRRVAHQVGVMLDIASYEPGDESDQDFSEDDYEVTYQLPGDDIAHRVMVKAISEVDAMTVFYENAPEEYHAHIKSVEISKKH